MDLWTPVGTVASLVGLATSVWVLVVAKNARDAAEAASAAARKRNLVEELESLSHKFQQVGTLIQQEQWVAVRMWIDEVTASCRVTLTRWPDQLSVERKNELMSAATLMSSIPKAIAVAEGEPLTPQQKRRFAETQMRASGHVHSALGEARREQDRNGDVTDAD
jgi:hypothetical protein